MRTVHWAALAATTAALALAAPAVADHHAGEGKHDEHEHGKGDAAGGNAFGVDLEGENAKHAMRLQKIARLEQIAKEKSRPDLLEKVARLREKETRRHEKVLARLAKKADKGKGDDKGKDDDKDKGKPDDVKDKVKDKAKEKAEELKDKELKDKKAKGKGKKE